MESGELWADVYRLRAAASQQGALGTGIGFLVPPSFQPITAVSGGIDTVVFRAEGALRASARAATSAVAERAAGDATNDATAAAEMVALWQCVVV